MLIDVADLELALLNLLTNARDAMPDGGTIRISVAPRARGAGARRPVVLGVHDTGGGMPPEVQERAFEPFFTTKSIGKGTGLGLSSVYGFARQSGGTARIESRAGAGYQRAARAAGQRAAAHGAAPPASQAAGAAAGARTPGGARERGCWWSRTTCWSAWSRSRRSRKPATR